MSRWRIAVLVSVAIAISYLDRQTLPVAIKAIARDIPVTNEQFSLLQSSFLFAYALMYVGGGWVMDKIGTKTGFLLIMVLWSIACAGHALAGSVGVLVLWRALLGVGEGGGFPAATRVVAEWFPPPQRSSAMGIINAGTAIGMIAAPPLIATILGFASWRWIFLIAGAGGLAWTLVWHRAYFVPASGPSSDEPRDPDALGFGWREVLRCRETWGLVTAKFLSDAAWYFFLFWLPKYLYDARGFDVKQVGVFAWIPAAAAGLGCLAGGYFSSWLFGRLGSLDLARKIALGLSACAMPFMLLVPHVSIGWVIPLFSLAYFGQQSWSTLVMTLPADLFPRRSVGTVAGLVGFGGAMGGVVFGEIVGVLLDHGHGYGVVFAIAASLHLIAFAALLLGVTRVRSLAEETAPESVAAQCLA